MTYETSVIKFNTQLEFLYAIFLGQATNFS